ncbi:nucleotide exchange factor GrpE [Oceanicaulis alexandrii]|uniref:nucleotide exchange factor GrpE n=1 Tax=Oceanicaulis alexandrii TaxID=153233 RepID=UPI0035D08B10
MSTENQTPETEDAELNAEADAALAAEAEAEDTASEEPDPAEEISNLKDQLLRALAEMENTKKRAEREVKDTRAYAVTGFARDMLDVADNLSRALQSISEESKSEAGEALKTLLEGVEMTERRLLSSLERHGVKKVEPSPGDALDPNMHQAAAQIPADQPKGAIAHVMQPGYKIGDRTLRAAMVVVSAGPATPPEGGEAEGGVDVSA